MCTFDIVIIWAIFLLIHDMIPTSISKQFNIVLIIATDTEIGKIDIFDIKLSHLIIVFIMPWHNSIPIRKLEFLIARFD